MLPTTTSTWCQRDETKERQAHPGYAAMMNTVDKCWIFVDELGRGAMLGVEAAVQTELVRGIFLFWLRPFGPYHLTKILLLSGSRSLRESIRTDRHESSIHLLAEQIARLLAGTLIPWQSSPCHRVVSWACGVYCRPAGSRD